MSKESGTQNAEPGTQNAEHRTQNTERKNRGHNMASVFIRE
jgi:hypothetical protein